MTSGSSGGKKVPVKEITPEEWEKVDQIIAEHKDKSGSLIPVLQQVQEVCGFLPEEVQNRVAEGLNMHPSHVFGVTTFYSFFTLVPRGRNIVRLCMGTACYVKGAEKVLQEFERILDITTGGVTDDRQFSIESLRCVGACGLAPVVMINDKAYGKVQPEDVRELLAPYLVAV